MCDRCAPATAVAKPVRALVELARQIGAMRGNKPDWYEVALFLALERDPNLPLGTISPPPRPRGPRFETWLLRRDVQVMMFWTRRSGKPCGVGKACQLLTKGRVPRCDGVQLVQLSGGGEMAVVDGLGVPMPSKHWVDRNWKTLKTRYFEVSGLLKK
jgi:hypothetical protein